MKVLIVKSVPHSFRRAGLRFTQQETRLKVDEITADQLKAIQAEKNLVSHLVEVPDESKGASGDGDKIEKLVTLIDELDLDDQTLWTSSNKPQTSALEGLLGESVSAAERDKAFEQYQAKGKGE
ncbi:HI1506-related protein [Hydrogenovibrio sp. 3SP14C1]|uniref:HI1506-related protein n=1 Tax=Hydrogenovibrio sp. 3SP14C1 TaxID=3038774 RepID=UPI002416A44D|nr:HI1506-related protein [Hydrogenovibrio sp. 3SP14C1]MDG4811662.1 HI1506-related protein [Hydrogenovibrio sp. 3SP14C1]